MRFHKCLSTLVSSSFVPNHNPVKPKDVVELSNFIQNNSNILVLTGAGISTESGLPDYRSEDVGLYSRNQNKKEPYVPMRYQEFVKNNKSRTRFWLRSYLGWMQMSKIQPNETHNTLKKMEILNKLTCIITQNVDSLHKKAESLNIIELHGSAYRVVCVNCEYKTLRHLFQETLTFLNPHFNERISAIAPDGFVELEKDEEITFITPDCPECGGILKPDMVFFGENIPKSRMNRVNDELNKCKSLLVLGSSLAVPSSYRIVSSCFESKKPIAIINIGPTKGDSQAVLKIEARCGEILPLTFKHVCEQIM